MIFRISLEWEYEPGNSLMKKVDFLIEELEGFFLLKNYGNSIDSVSIVLSYIERDIKPRKRFKKAIGRFEYDIVLDYYLIKNIEFEQKIGVIKRQLVEISEKVFASYKFEDFNKSAFLEDLGKVVYSFE